MSVPFTWAEHVRSILHTNDLGRGIIYGIEMQKKKFNVRMKITLPFLKCWRHKLLGNNLKNSICVRIKLVAKKLESTKFFAFLFAAITCRHFLSCLI